MAKYLILLAFLSVLKITFGRIGFIKDQSTTKWRFPPKIQRTYDHAVPMGHLRSLGFQRQPESKVPEISQMPHPQDFFENFINRTKPVVFRIAMKNVPAVENWKKDEYLKKQYGHLDIHVVVKKQLFKTGPQKIKFKTFLKEYNFEDWYLSTIIPQEMMGELLFPKSLKCGMTQFLQESEIWMSSGGTSSTLHSHADHNIHCVLAGRKDFILINPKYKDKLYYQDKEPHIGAGYSEVDVDMINMYKHPLIAQVPWSWSTLNPGDCIFVPATYIHQVRSYGRSFSSTILWTPSPDIDFTSCPSDEDLDKPMPLTEAPLIWTYLKADRELANIDLDATSLRHHLVVWMRNEPSLRYEVFKDYYEEIMSELQPHEIPNINEVWKSLSRDSELKAIPRENIANLDEESLATVAEFLNKPHVLHGHTKARDEL